MAQTRPLDTATLKGAIRDYCGHWFLPTQWSRKNPKVAIYGRDWVMQSLYNSHFKDEFEYVLAGMRNQFGQDALTEFNKAAADMFTPRDDAVFEQLLAEKLAIRPDGTKIKDAIGTTQIGTVITGYRPKTLMLRKSSKSGPREVVIMKPVKAPVYAGQEHLFGVGAQNMNVSAESIILGLDAIVDNLDEGIGAAVIQGRTGAQPADPDAVTTGTLLFTLVCSDPAFGAAADQADGTVDAAAAAITDDTSADATGTLGYCRASATNDGATPLDDHIDGEAGTSGADFNFNTLSIQSGATVSMTAWTITFDQGTTAT